MEDSTSQPLRDLLERVLLDSSFAWWESNIVSNEVTSNDLKLTMLGYDPADFSNAPYQAYTDLLHPDDYERTMQAMRDHLEGRARIYQVDYRIKRSDGNYNWYMDRGLIISRLPDGSPERLRGIVIDLGEEFTAALSDQERVRLIRNALPSTQSGKNHITLCSNCKRLKVGEDDWIKVDASLYRAFPKSVSHGICPDCIRMLYPDLADRLLAKPS